MGRVIGGGSAWKKESDRLVAPLPESFVVPVETTRRLAESSVDQSALTASNGDQVIIDGAAASLTSLSKKWGC